MSPMRNRLALSLAAAVLTAAAFLLAGRGGDSPAPRTEHPVTVPAELRTVNVSASMPLASAHARRLSAMLETGTMPAHATTAEVLSDTDCAPDAEMISRCRNEIRLADGSTVVLRHPHNMTKVPCLAPGERIRLVPLDV